MFNTKEINGKSYVVYENFIYDDETMEWILIDEFEPKSPINQENISWFETNYLSFENIKKFIIL
jgi:hypothetical protein